MKKLVVLAALIISALSATSARANILGTNVSGTLTIGGSTTNFFTSPNAIVTPGTIPEFSGSYDVTLMTARKTFNEATDTVSVYFGANGVLIEDQCTRILLGGCLLSPAFSVSFTSPSINEADVFLFAAAPNFKSYSVIGNTLNVNFFALGPGNLLDNSFSAFSILTPEPSSLLLLGTGATGIAGLLRRRLFA